MPPVRSERLPAERLRDLLLALLALTTGAVDATAFDRLGHVFASVVTGNLILLGISAEQADGKLALFGGCTLGCYALGVILVAPRDRRTPDRGPRDRRTPDRRTRADAGRPDDPDRSSLWPAGATRALLADLALLVVFSVVWEAVGEQPDQAFKLVLLGLAAAAMGTQSCAVRQLGGFSTTYLTSTLTGVLEQLIARSWSAATTRSVVIILAAVAAAAGAIGLITEAHAALPILPLVPLVTVIITARRRLQS